MESDDSNVTPLPRRDIIGDVSSAELTRVVNLLLESMRQTTASVTQHKRDCTARIEAFERASAQLRDADRAHYELMRSQAAEDRRAMIEAMRDLKTYVSDTMEALGGRLELAAAKTTQLAQVVAAYTGQAPDGQGKIKKYAPAVLGGAGGGFALLELVKAIAHAIKTLQG